MIKEYDPEARFLTVREIEDPDPRPSTDLVSWSGNRPGGNSSTDHYLVACLRFALRVPGYEPDVLLDTSPQILSCHRRHLGVKPEGDPCQTAPAQSSRRTR